MMRAFASIVVILLMSIGFALNAQAQTCDCETFKNNVGLCELGKRLGYNKAEETCADGTARNMNLSAECKAQCTAPPLENPPAPPPPTDDAPPPPPPPPPPDSEE